MPCKSQDCRRALALPKRLCVWDALQLYLLTLLALLAENDHLALRGTHQQLMSEEVRCSPEATGVETVGCCQQQRSLLPSRAC
jgi:hypothetical protein